MGSPPGGANHFFTVACHKVGKHWFSGSIAIACTTLGFNKGTSAWQQASEESACFQSSGD